MTTGKVELGGVQSTMLVTLYLRALDSREKEPILGDRAAAEAVDRIDYNFGKLKWTAGNRFLVAVRARQFDEWAGDFLRRHPDATVVQLGCGLDSRPLRLALPEGVRWFDVDFPDVIDLRRKLYEETDRYRMLPSSVTDPDWLTEIPAENPVLIIAEGVLMYLDEPDIRLLLQRITDRFPAGELLFDGVSAGMTRFLQRIPSRLTSYPAYSTAIEDGRVVEQWNPRLTHADTAAIVPQYPRIPHPAYRTLYRLLTRIPALRDWIRVFRFTF
ncbi:class I SAM-dependent methyltransferase [Nocardia transvalensis]|uniref:class I SAM-dependent methyltransferase n=1 Tax=Nocardia transvalensis TaxID=37333 RepID=UPI0018942F0B|nr:class I SAM-dependent methyltransferase [Nocardia transvalensis]MBF6329309.1 class I SAM-dependent methyltransferase [Nocardia transvalensis]